MGADYSAPVDKQIRCFLSREACGFNKPQNTGLFKAKQPLSLVKLQTG